MSSLARIVASKHELTLKLGDRILGLGYRARGQRELAVRPIAACADDMLGVDNGGAYRLKPSCLDTDFEVSGEPGWITPPSATIARLKGATVTAGVVFTDGRAIAETIPDVERFGPFRRERGGALYQARTRFSVQRHIGGGPVVLLKHAIDADYARWIVEDLTRLAMVENCFDLGRLRFIVSATASPMRAAREDSLALFGIRAEQIVEAGDETLQVDDLLYPSALTRGQSAIAPRCIAVLEQLATRVRANPFGHRRLYVRAPEGQRRLRDEPAIAAIAERAGFAVIEPETMSLYQRIGLFRQARCVVGEARAALADALFSTDVLTLGALTPPDAPDTLFPHCLGIKDGRYMVLRGEGAPRDGGAEAGFTIDPARFDAMLRAIANPS